MVNNVQLALGKISQNPVFIAPPEMNVDNFEELKNDDGDWFNTHVGGYKMCLNVNANGWAGGNGTHVGLFVFMMRGDFDSHLMWPFKGEITVELVNQKEGGKSYASQPIKLNPDESNDCFQRVTDGDRA